MSAKALHGDFSSGSIPRAITRLSLPLIGAQMINALYSVVDRMYIGRIPGVGSLALTGVGVTFPFLMLISAFANLAGMGGAPLASIARGEGNDRQAQRILGNSFTLLLMFGVILTLFSFLLKRPALYLFGASDATFPYADTYLSVYVIGSLFVMISVGMNNFISIQGSARTAMLTVVIGALFNIVLDPLFIFALDMGVAGAALATVISQAFSALWVLRYLTGKKRVLRLRIQFMRLDRKLTWKILSLGFSSFIMSVNDSLVSIICNTSLQRYGGDLYVGVMTAISSVRQILTMPLGGFGQGALPVISFNYGARLLSRVRASILFTLKLCVFYALFVTLCAEAFPRFLLSLFTEDEALISAGIPCIRLYFMLFPFMGLQMTGQRSYLALGKAKQATFFSLLRKILIVVPLTLLLPQIPFLGVYGVFCAEPISDLIGPTACFTTFMLTLWPRLREDSFQKSS